MRVQSTEMKRKDQKMPRTEARVRKLSALYTFPDHSYGDRWYVSRVVPIADSLDIESEKSEYLHSDGEWRPTTVHLGVFSGLYTSEATAEGMLSRVNA